MTPKETDAEISALRAEIDDLRKQVDHLEDLAIMASSFKISPRISVEERGKGKWCVYDMGDVLNVDGEWELEPTLPSSRDDDFLNRTRFDRDTAIRLAKEKAYGNKPRTGCPV